GYGHPDHVHTHLVTTAAVTVAGTGDYPGRPWSVPKFYWTVMAASALRAGRRALNPADLLAGWVLPPDGEGDLTGRLGYPDDEIGAVVDAEDAVPAKVAALRAHATQVTVGPTDRACALSNNRTLPILGSEHYILAAGTAGKRDERGWETDLLAGLDLTAVAAR
ncbi:MAG: N-acetyl-1-D-myo-inositol-2-amino-2-deoxy-alpha-D-glucopyranoside deacetylase, partial [Mycobacterium sp.]